MNLIKLFHRIFLNLILMWLLNWVLILLYYSIKYFQFLLLIIIASILFFELDLCLVFLQISSHFMKWIVFVIQLINTFFIFYLLCLTIFCFIINILLLQQILKVIFLCKYHFRTLTSLFSIMEWMTRITFILNLKFTWFNFLEWMRKRTYGIKGSLI